jgi:hypothetical protein
MTAELFDAFTSFIDTAQRRLQPEGPTPRSGPVLVLVRDQNERLRELVAQLQDCPQFERLIDLTRTSLAGPHHGIGESGWSRAVGTFFKRSGLYVDMAHAQPISTENAFQTYVSEVRKTRMHLAHFLALGNASFSSDLIDCGTFTIKHFTIEEMRALLRPDLRDPSGPGSLSTASCLTLPVFGTYG